MRNNGNPVAMVNHAQAENKSFCIEEKRRKQQETWVFGRLRSLIYTELKSVSASRQREKLPVATVTWRSDWTWGMGKFSCRTLWQLPGGSWGCTPKLRRSVQVGEPAGAGSGSDPESGPGSAAVLRPRQEAGRRLADPRDAFCALLLKSSVLSSVLLSKSPFIECSLTSFPTRFAAAGLWPWRSFPWQLYSLIKGNKVQAFNCELLLYFKSFFFFISFATVTPSLNRNANLPER